MSKTVYSLICSERQIAYNSSVSLTSEEVYEDCLRYAERSGCMYDEPADLYDTLDEANKAFCDFVKKHPVTTRPELGIHYCELSEAELDDDGEYTDHYIPLKRYAQPVVAGRRPWNK